MRTRTFAFYLFTLLVLALPLLADDRKKKQPAMDENAMMELWMKAMTPGEPHKLLDPFVGTFDFKVTTWMAPGAPPSESTGVSENRWVLGKRYVEQKVTGSFMDMPFEGVGYTGYDNVGKHYFGTWMDTMSTGMMTSTGNVEKDGKTFTFLGSMLDPMTGKAAKVKEKITVRSNDEIVMEMWAEAPDGKMFKNMEIVYTRKK